MDGRRDESCRNQKDEFNLLNEDLRGAMYRGGAEREAVYAGYGLGFLSILLFVAAMVVLGIILSVFGVSLAETIKYVSRELPLLFVAMVSAGFLVCIYIGFRLMSGDRL